MGWAFPCFIYSLLSCSLLLLFSSGVHGQREIPLRERLWCIPQEARRERQRFHRLWEDRLPVWRPEEKLQRGSWQVRKEGGVLLFCFQKGHSLRGRLCRFKKDLGRDFGTTPGLWGVVVILLLSKVSWFCLPVSSDCGLCPVFLLGGLSSSSAPWWFGMPLTGRWRQLTAVGLASSVHHTFISCIEQNLHRCLTPSPVSPSLCHRVPAG